MRIRTPLLLAAAAAALVAGTTLPASAAGTQTTFTVTAGTISISAPASASLGSQTATVGNSTITGPLGTVTVTDQRGGILGWTASVISTAFTPSAGPADPASNITYTPGTITTVGTVTATGSSAADLTTNKPVVVATLVNGGNSATWGPTLAVVVPGGFVTGTYTATVTHSVA